MPTQTTPTRSSQSPPAQSRADRAHQTWTIVLAGLGVFMTALDTLVVATALPVLRTSLHTSLAGLEWTVNAYILSFACLLLTGAALGDRFGRRRMFAVGVAVFTLGSAGSVFLMTQLLQFALGDSPLSAGVRLLPWTGAPMVVAPLAGALADRYGNRPFMVVGLALQAAGLGWVALAAAPGMGYTQLGIALAIAGIGISMCFPTVSNAVLASVPPAEAGVASGTNSTMRELGAVFGVALLATVFARHGVYHSPRLFIDGFTPAVWVGAGLSALGIPAALAGTGMRAEGECLPASVTPGRGRAAEATAAVAQPAMALSGEPA